MVNSSHPPAGDPKKKSKKFREIEKIIRHCFIDDPGNTIRAAEAFQIYRDYCVPLGLPLTNINVLGMRLGNFFRSNGPMGKRLYYCRPRRTSLVEGSSGNSNSTVSESGSEPELSRAPDNFRKVVVIPEKGVAIEQAGSNRNKLEARIVLPSGISIYLPIEGVDLELLTRLGGMQ